MASPADFLTQQEMATNKRESLKAKKTSDLEDHEKIYLLKREIDDLRSQLKDGNNGGQTSPALGSTTSSTTTSNGNCTGFLCSKTPMLGLFVFVGIALLTRWGRRRGLFTTSSSLGSGRSRRRSNLLGGDDGEGVTTIQFELQDTASSSRDVYQAPEATVVQFV